MYDSVEQYRKCKRGMKAWEWILTIPTSKVVTSKPKIVTILSRENGYKELARTQRLFLSTCNSMSFEGKRRKG